MCDEAIGVVARPKGDEAGVDAIVASDTEEEVPGTSCEEALEANEGTTHVETGIAAKPGSDAELEAKVADVLEDTCGGRGECGTDGP